MPLDHLSRSGLPRCNQDDDQKNNASDAERVAILVRRYAQITRLA